LMILRTILKAMDIRLIKGNSMKFKTVFLMILILIATSAASQAFVRTYKQFRDVSVNEAGKVRQSTDLHDMFEFKYDIDPDNKKVTRILMRRLDDPIGKTDSAVYTLKEIKRVFDSPEGRGGLVFVAVSRDGEELIELGGNSAFTSRTSMFSQVITGVYKRIYTEEDHEPHHHHYK
jgi:hypothetical protein